MSHNDYTKYARESKVEAPEAPVEVKPEPVIEDVKPEVVEAFATGTIIEPVVEEAKPEMPEVIEETESHKMGRVFGCTRLNVRKLPKPRAEVVCEIPVNTKVEIDEVNSTVDFYKIFTSSGIEGYCVKTYIDVVK